MEKTFIEKIKALPIELQDAITSPEFGEKLETLGEKHNLHIDQIDELANEILAIMIGEAKSIDFYAHIKKTLSVTEGEARAITTDVNEQIFLPLREVLMRPTSETPQHMETPDEILKHIEDAGPALPAPDLTDHLLQNTVESKPIEEAPKEVAPSHPTPPPKKTYSVDPYREPTN